MENERRDLRASIKYNSDYCLYQIAEQKKCLSPLVEVLKRLSYRQGNDKNRVMKVDDVGFMRKMLDRELGWDSYSPLAIRLYKDMGVDHRMPRNADRVRLRSRLRDSYDAPADSYNECIIRDAMILKDTDKAERDMSTRARSPRRAATIDVERTPHTETRTEEIPARSIPEIEKPGPPLPPGHPLPLGIPPPPPPPPIEGYELPMPEKIGKQQKKPCLTPAN